MERRLRTQALGAIIASCMVGLAAGGDPEPQAHDACGAALGDVCVVAVHKLSRKARDRVQPPIDLGTLDSGALSPEPIGVGDQFAVEVKNLPSWEKAKHPNLSKPAFYSKLILYLDGKPLTDERPLSDSSDDSLIFELVRTAQTKDLWKSLLSRPCVPSCDVRSLRLTVGFEGEGPFNSTAIIMLRAMRSAWIWAIVIALVVAGLALFGSKARRGATSKLVRADSGDSNVLGPFSLARVQMAWWFVWVVLAYIVIYAITGYYDVLGSSVLVLIGISSGTTAFAAVVDNSGRSQAQQDLIKRTDERNRAQEALRAASGEIAKLQRDREILNAQLQNLQRDLDTAKAQQSPTISDTEKKVADKTTEVEKAIAGIDAQTKMKAELEMEIAQKQADISSLQQIISPRTNGFFKDILSFSGSGTGLHRVQMIVWTLILTVIFLLEVFRTLTMPQFPAELLGLMGISSGAYVGFKAVTQ